MKRLMHGCGAAVLALALLAAPGCDSTDQDRDRDRLITVDADGYTSVDLVALSTWLATVPNQPLSNAETEALLYAREEEKMARDAFRVFDQQYDPAAFTKIADSEQTHMDAIGMLLDKYGLADPVTNDATGAFTDPDILALYQDFLDQGDDALTGGLEAGAAIQEMAVRDLGSWLGAVDNRDVTCVFSNLQKGSRNHLRRLVDLLQDRGVTYVPVYLPQATYDAILADDMERGTAC